MIQKILPINTKIFRGNKLILLLTNNKINVIIKIIKENDFP